MIKMSQFCLKQAKHTIYYGHVCKTYQSTMQYMAKRSIKLFRSQATDSGPPSTLRSVSPPAFRLHQTQIRLFSSTNSNAEETNSENNDKQEEVPVSMKNRIIFVSIFALACGVGFFFMNRKKKTEKLQDREVQLSKMDIGAEDYNLTNHLGERVTKKDFLGHWLLLYFGFTHCPDICPEELEKMSEIVDLVDADKGIPDILPIFLSVDPERDTPKAIKDYLAEFHSKFVGLTGTTEEVKQATKAFRVYYQAGPKDDDNDYIVDHTIVMYLMNPKGNFVDYYGSRSVPTEKIVSGIRNNMLNYKRLHG